MFRVLTDLQVLGYFHVLMDHLPSSSVIAPSAKVTLLVLGWDQRCKSEYGNSLIPEIATKWGLLGGNNQPHTRKETCRNPGTISNTSLFNETCFPAPCWLGKQASSFLLFLSLPALLSTEALLWPKQWGFAFHVLRTDFRLGQLADLCGGMEGQKLLKAVQGMAEPPRLRAKEEIRMSSGQKFFLFCLESKQLLCTLGNYPLTCWVGEKGLVAPDFFPKVAGKFSRFQK